MEALTHYRQIIRNLINMRRVPLPRLARYAPVIIDEKQGHYELNLRWLGRKLSGSWEHISTRHPRRKGVDRERWHL